MIKATVKDIQPHFSIFRLISLINSTLDKHKPVYIQFYGKRAGT